MLTSKGYLKLTRPVLNKRKIMSKVHIDLDDNIGYAYNTANNELYYKPCS